MSAISDTYDLKKENFLGNFINEILVFKTPKNIAIESTYHQPEFKKYNSNIIYNILIKFIISSQYIFKELNGTLLFVFLIFQRVTKNLSIEILWYLKLISTT